MLPIDITFDDSPATYQTPAGQDFNLKFGLEQF